MKHFLNDYSAALGYTLLHSLWQGLLIFSVFIGAFFLFKSSTKRYWTGILALFSQLLISIFTFYYFTETRTILDTGSSLHITGGVESSSFMIFFMKNVETISFLWFMGVTLLFGRMTVGLLYIQNLRKDVKPILEPQVKDLVISLKNRLGVRTLVPILESAKVTVPMTLGWLKPIILLPVGLAVGLEVRQLEAILAHELSHVKRQDYLINILQSIIEIVFFYHPLIWIISGKVREERENCCDDMALEVCGNNRLILAKALASVASFELQPVYAMAFGSRNNSLKNRIKRVLGFYPQRSFTLLNWGMTAMLLTITVGGYVYAMDDKHEVETSKIIPHQSVGRNSKATNDSLPHNLPQPKPLVSVVFDEIIKHRRVEQIVVLDFPSSKKYKSEGISVKRPEIKELTSTTRDSSFSSNHSNVYTSDWKLKRLMNDITDKDKNSSVRMTKGKLLVNGNETSDEEYQILHKHLEKNYAKMGYFSDNNFLLKRENGNVRVYFLNRDYKEENIHSIFENHQRWLEVREFQKLLKRRNIVNSKRDFVLVLNPDSTVVNGKVLTEKKHKKILKGLDKLSSFESYSNGFTFEKNGIRTKLTDCSEKEK